MKIGILEGRIVMDFGKPVHTIGMPPDECIKFAEVLIKKALKAKEDESNH